MTVNFVHSLVSFRVTFAGGVMPADCRLRVFQRFSFFRDDSLQNGVCNRELSVKFSSHFLPKSATIKEGFTSRALNYNRLLVEVELRWAVRILSLCLHFAVCIRVCLVKRCHSFRLLSTAR